LAREAAKDARTEGKMDLALRQDAPPLRNERSVDAAVVRSDVLTHFKETVRHLGADPDALLRKEGIPVEAPHTPGMMISYRRMARLFHRTGLELGCPDFGLILAARQGWVAGLGPLAVAMTNSVTIGDAYRYCAQHLQIYSPAVRISVENEEETKQPYIRFEILLNRLPHQQQAVEHAFALTHLSALAMSNNTVRATKIWFAHNAVSPINRYKRYFCADVEVNAPFNALFFDKDDFAKPVVNSDRQLYEIATTFIDHQFPTMASSFSVQVRSAIARMLGTDVCSREHVAAALGLHPRTMQRRLRVEGRCFESIKDEVRQEAALKYLGQATVPLSHIAAMLGYSEASVLTRRCRHWFLKSPRQMRRDMVRH